MYEIIHKLLLWLIHTHTPKHFKLLIHGGRLERIIMINKYIFFKYTHKK